MADLFGLSLVTLLGATVYSVYQENKFLGEGDVAKTFGPAVNVTDRSANPQLKDPLVQWVTSGRTAIIPMPANTPAMNKRRQAQEIGMPDLGQRIGRRALQPGYDFAYPPPVIPASCTSQMQALTKGPNWGMGNMSTNHTAYLTARSGTLSMNVLPYNNYDPNPEGNYFQGVPGSDFGLKFIHGKTPVVQNTSHMTKTHKRRETINIRSRHDL